MTVDYATIHLCNALLNASYAAMFFVLWLRRRELHLLLFAASLIMVAAAVYGFTLTRNPVAIAALLAVISCNISLTWAGARAFDGRRPYHWGQAVAPTTTFLGHLAFVFLDLKPLADTFATALLAVNVLLTSLYFLRNEHGFARRATGWVLSAYAPLYLTAIVLGALSPGTRVASVTILVGDFVLNNLFVVGLFAMMEEKAREALRLAAATDHLTGVLNRAGMLGRFPDGHVLEARALVLADLDHFKRINDTHGHAGGDAALQTFVARVGELLKPGECIGRLGGEEFGIMLGAGDVASARRRADEIRDRLAREPVTWNGSAIAVTASFGIAIGQREDTFEAMLSRADDALYRAKRAGRNQVAA